MLVSSLAHLNLSEEAKDAVDYYLENIPDVSISDIRNSLRAMRPDLALRFEEGLRKAGLPE